MLAGALSRGVAAAQSALYWTSGEGWGQQEHAAVRFQLAAEALARLHGHPELSLWAEPPPGLLWPAGLCSPARLFSAWLSTRGGHKRFPTEDLSFPPARAPVHSPSPLLSHVSQAWVAAGKGPGASLGLFVSSPGGSGCCSLRSDSSETR